MKKFMAIYMASGADFERMMKNSTPEQRNKGMEAWMKWMNENKASILEGGAPLGKTKRADATGISDTKNNIGGYSIVQAETHERGSETVRQGPPTSSNARCMGGNSRNHAASGDVIRAVIRLLSYREDGLRQQARTRRCRDATVSRVDAVPS